LSQTDQAHLHTEHMALIDKETSMSILGALFTIMVYTYILYDHVNNSILFTWLAVISLVYGVRFLINHHVLPLKRTNSFHWEKTALLGTFLTGLLWGLGSYFMMPANNPLLQAVIVLTVGGLVAAASVTYAPSKTLGTAFNIPALLPLSVFFFQQQGNEYFYMGTLVLIYSTVMFFSNKLMHGVTSKSILLGLKNDTLINDLTNKIVEIEDLASEMSYQATHDMLTGLINRREFELRLKKTISEIKYSEKNHVLCYMDLDEFKIVNDTCGHIAGDALLKKLADHLMHNIRSNDTLARLGGDEFGLLLPSCNIEKAFEIADKLREAIKQFRFTWENNIFDIGVSIGLVEINENTGNLTDILKAVDSACYIAKDLGKNRIHIYEEDDLKLTERLDYMYSAQAVQKSLADNRFMLYAQEIRAINKDTNKWHGELLIRMINEEGNLILPDQFIPAAERYHLMTDIDKWVVNEAFIFIKQLEQQFPDAVLCTINLSGQSVCDKLFLNYVIEKFTEIKVPPSSVCFEITETAAVENFFHAERLLEVLKGIGCSFSLDDFGSGLSSFGYLKKLDVNYLKIDGSFVKTMLEDKKDYAMVKSINQIGKEMGIKTVAEFVENDDILRELKKLNVDYVQGYGIGRPVPVSSLILDDKIKASNQY